jgi:hypothetical protein
VPRRAKSLRILMLGLMVRLDPLMTSNGILVQPWSALIMITVYGNLVRESLKMK